MAKFILVHLLNQETGSYDRQVLNTNNIENVWEQQGQVKIWLCGSEGESGNVIPKETFEELTHMLGASSAAQIVTKH